MVARAIQFALIAGALAACGDGAGDARTTAKGLRVGILVADGVDDAALASVVGVFSAVEPSGESAPSVRLLSMHGDPVTTRAGLSIGPTVPFESAGAADVLVVAAVPEPLSFRSERRNTFDHRVRDDVRWTIALGAATFEFAGYDGAPLPIATSFVVADHVVASAGGAAADDAALFVVERVFGERVAAAAATRCGRSWSLDRVRHMVVGAGGGAGLRVGESLPAQARVFDAEGAPHRILDGIAPTDRVLVLCVYGGGSANPQVGKAGLWCEDSYFEMANVRHAMARFAAEPVRFVGIACPPVFHEEKFGYVAGGFSPEHPGHASQRTRFVDATRAARDAGVLPFAELWFDPTFRLMAKDATRPLAEDGTGALRAPDEAQTYGTPTIWILDRDGRVLTPPFFGNNWEKDRELRFTSRDLEDTIRAALIATAR
ncbi:MAG: hypothetical protein JNL94_13935 [Planctomycetes bacterium]|nr:hypothetical protein [Planctomycetota bacterium]